MAALLLASCGSPRLPLVLQDTRTQPTPRGELACVDVFAVTPGSEAERIKATPADEYFATIGRPARPQAVWRFFPDDAAAPRVLRPGHPLFGRWDEAGADTMVAVCTVPRPRLQKRMEQRMILFSLDPGEYPRGTRSLDLTLSDAGLALSPSGQEAPPPPTND